MKRNIYKKSNKGFTLVELIIVIAILAIIMLIASLAYGGIQQRMKARADKVTCREIGEALCVREADLDKSKGIQLYPAVVEYDSLDDIDNYIKSGLTPQSMPDGGYIVSAIQTETGKKIIVGIGKDGQDIYTYPYVDKQEAGWVWTEGKEINKFIEENVDKFSMVKVISGVTGGEEASGGESSTLGIISNSEVPVGSYIDYDSGNSSYEGKWVVLRNNSGSIEIISKYSVGNVTLSGADDYAKAVKKLNNKAREYINSKYAIAGRSVGTTNSSIQEINQPITFAAARSQELPYYDETYEDDQDVINAHASLQHSGWVWLASRILLVNSDYSDFNVRIFNGTTYISDILYRATFDNTTQDFSPVYGVRPVITLKSRIRITGGNGTEGNPYKISL